MAVPMTPQAIDEALNAVRGTLPRFHEALREESRKRLSATLELWSRVDAAQLAKMTPEERDRELARREENRRQIEEARQRVIPVGTPVVIESEQDWGGAFSVIGVRFVTGPLTRGELDNMTVEQLAEAGKLGSGIDYEEK